MGRDPLTLEERERHCRIGIGVGRLQEGATHHKTREEHLRMRREERAKEAAEQVTCHGAKEGEGGPQV